MGEDAWAHLRTTASAEMAVFLEKYIHAPLDAVVDSLSDDEALPNLQLSDQVNSVQFKVGDDSWLVARAATRGVLEADEA